MEPKIGRTYLYYETAKDIWVAVYVIYPDLENTAQCFKIRLPSHYKVEHVYYYKIL